MPKLLSRDFIEGPAFAVLNEYLSHYFHSDEGIARPNRYEVILYAPAANVTGGGRPGLADVYAQILTEKKGEGKQIQSTFFFEEWTQLVERSSKTMSFGVVGG